MATLASAILSAEPEATDQSPMHAAARTAAAATLRAAPLPVDATSEPDAAIAYARSTYQPSRRSAPLAMAASAGLLLAAAAALTTLSMAARHERTERLTVVSVQELDTTPPPPPPAESLEKPVVQPPQAFTPQPKIQLPAPGPTQVALDIPPPVQPVAPAMVNVAAPVAAAAAAPAANAASSDPVEGGDLSSQVLSARPPVYPVDARRRKQQGTVKLMVLVGPDGRVSDLRVAVSSGSDLLDQAALKAVKHWRWTPQKKDGVAVAVRGTVPVTFGLS